MKGQQVLEWIKANVVIVIFAVVMIAAPVAMFVVAGSMNKSVKDDVNKRAILLSQMNSTVDLPDGTQVTPTEKLLRDYQAISKTLADDAAAVQKRALEFNRKGHNVLMADVFPQPQSFRLQTIPLDFHNALVAAYDRLLMDLGAGSPPELESLREALEGRRVRFITQDLKKDVNAPLEPEESERLKKMLSDVRLDMYKQKAASTAFYATTAGLDVPQWNQEHIPPPAEMFNWQWQYWAIEDVLHAVAEANKGSTSVADAPIKRVIGIVVNGLPGVAAADDAGGQGGGEGRLSGGFGAEGAGAPPAGADAGGGEAAAAGMPANPKAAIPRDYSQSFSGLVSNPLFDVLFIDFAIVVEAERLPSVLDAISRYNFNTITNLRIEAVDSFASTEQGFYFGNKPVCLATIRMETVWLREWTKAYMPEATRAELGIAPDAPRMPADAPPPAG